MVTGPKVWVRASRTPSFPKGFDRLGWTLAAIANATGGLLSSHCILLSFCTLNLSKPPAYAFYCLFLEVMLLYAYAELVTKKKPHVNTIPHEQEKYYQNAYDSISRYGNPARLGKGMVARYVEVVSVTFFPDA